MKLSISDSLEPTGSGQLSQLWLFWLAPILGALIGGMAYGWLGRDEPDIVGNS